MNPRRRRRRNNLRRGVNPSRRKRVKVNTEVGQGIRRIRIKIEKKIKISENE